MSVSTTGGRRYVDDGDVDAFSIGDFCRRHDISPSFYHKLVAQGLGPRTLKLGSRTLITREAARAWRRRHERRSVRAAARISTA